MTKARSIAGKIVLAIGVPLLALAAAEAACRALGIGYPTGFLLRAAVRDREALVDNPFYGYRFFPPRLARNPAPILTRPEKPPGTLRIVVLGESAAQGDPLMEFGLPRVLNYLLQDAAASGRVEVVNAAMTAINSSIVVDIARAMRACRPDLYVLYIGNNEVIGPYGPGTVFTPWPGLIRLAPLRAALTRFRFAYVLREGLAALRPGRKGPAGWGGLAMFSERQVPFGSPALDAMYDQYERNLRAIVRVARAAGAKVILSTVAVNLADCPPFASEEAAAEFERARQEQAAGRTGEALRLFQRARDLDTSRFRTDSVLNERMRRLAAEMEVPLVDAEAAFEAAATNGLPGRALFADHVHFTFHGTYHLARAIAGAVGELYPERFPDRAWPEEAALRRRLLYTPWNEQQMTLIMADRRRHPPFDRQPGNAAQLRELEDEARRLSAVLAQADLVQLEADFKDRMEEAPEDFFFPFQWGAILGDRGRWDDAAAVLRPALDLVPLHFEARKLPALALCRIGRTEEAARVLLGPASLRGTFVAEYALEIMGWLDQQGQAAAAAALARELLDQAPRLPWRERIQAASNALNARNR